MSGDAGARVNKVGDPDTENALTQQELACTAGQDHQRTGNNVEELQPPQLVSSSFAISHFL